MSDSDYWARQRVIVTAGASGIGLEIARAFRDKGSAVWVCDIVDDMLAATEKEGFASRRCDVSDIDAVDAFVAEATAAMGGLDILVNNAGIAGPAAPLHELDVAAWKRTFDVNVHGQFYVARAAIPHLKIAAAAHGGASMVCMASVAGKYAFPLRAPYAASKAAVIAMARSLSVELGPEQIRVNAIAPGVVAGDRIRRVFTDRAATKGISYDDMAALALKAVSMKTMVEPDEIAALVIYLTSKAGRPVSGQVLSICGGLEYTE
ncbi:SDR family oxidoreductase [Bosea sp. 685]|uniref:SDR family oxidoreductase n=1 Tax=Bosea sp. 685 TaxID=3080057 RepID=UPI002892EEA8|nr:SDR family oxidoreductase [Bosea sp. 685]WNJ88083.1 SDR family oxidoreductase [Bosea sp. 685]